MEGTCISCTKGYEGARCTERTFFSFYSGVGVGVLISNTATITGQLLIFPVSSSYLKFDKLL